jgi:hypothetical protein
VAEGDAAKSVGVVGGPHHQADRGDHRARILAAFGAGPSERAELLAYNASPYDHRRLPSSLTLPLPAEPAVATWEQYAAEAARDGAFAALARHLPQLRFPIRAGISQSEAYRAATRRGVSPDALPEATGLVLARPEAVQLVVHTSVAGPVPVLIAPERADFVALVQALGKRNEPWPVPPSQGATTVRGFNNWDRVRAYRQQWEADDPAARNELTWAAELERLVPRHELYQDTFIILSDGPYSGVAAADVGLDDEAWRDLSRAIRLEHECLHYLTLRLFGLIRNNAFDELLADYVGIVAATGRYRADWLLRFLGLEAYPVYRPGGRLQNYRGEPPLSDAAFRVVQALVHAAARNLERADAARFPAGASAADRVFFLAALTGRTLEELAATDLAEPE